ncbi:sensor histidine kinase [Halorubrum sp. N11]|uniref:sensor histidine kinase n=1 Tax=Halorubrum sp. N11 TaxID=3402276 RepID=UPI003EBEF1E1
MMFPQATAVRSLWPVWGLSVALLLSVVAEAATASLGMAATPDGYWVGVLSSMLVLLGVGYAIYWIPGSGLSVDRFQRLNRWWIAGATGFFLINLGFMLTLPTEGAFQVVGWARWAISFGAGIGLLVGLFEAKAIEREVTAERGRVRQAELRRERDRLEEFASVVSHDLRNPLAIVRGRVGLARQAYPEDEHLEAVDPALDRMESIIEETLTLAREGQSVDEIADVDTAECARECWSRVDTADATYHVEGSTTLQADRDRLLHVFENLFRNSVEHGGNDVTVRVGALEEGDGFYVEDDGDGIPQAKLDRVCETGFTSSRDGTGLGLAIVDRVVEAHGWALQIGEGDEGGARFEVSTVD